MKTKCSFILKSSIALILTALMIFGSLSTVLAATVDMAATGGWSWEATFKMGSNVSGGWDGSGQSATHTSGKKMVTYDFYFTHDDTHSDGEVRFAFWQDGSWDSRIVPTSNKTSIDGSSNKKDCTYGNSESRDQWYWVYNPSWLSDDGKYYKVTMNLDMEANNYNGQMWYTATALTSLSPTLTVPSTGTVGTAITLTGGSTDTGKVGTLTKTYQYSTDNGSTWTDLTSGSYTATSAGTVKFRYKVADGGITSSKAYALSDRIEYSEVKSCTFAAAPTTYNSIAVAAKGSNDGSTYSTTLSGATISANSYTTGTSALTITAGTVSGYTFAQWEVTSGSGTIGSATTASTTFTPSESNTTVTAQYKKNYTFSNGTTDTHGTVTVPGGTVLAGASYSGKVTPADGYKIKTLTVGGVSVSGAVGKTSAYTYSGTTGSSTTGTSTPISVVATFEPNTSMKLYIAGRFRVRPSADSTSWTTTYSGTADWNATSTSIPFTYMSGTTYKVDTYASLAELSAKIGSSSYTGDPVFFVYDKTETTAKNWYASSATTMSTTGVTLVSSGGSNSNLKFSSSSTDSPVTIYYDSNTHKIWYTIPDFYNVTVDPATGGTVTASPARCEKGTEVTLTIAPTTGYELTGITAKKGSTNVTLSGTGNTRTFTMPEGDVTVTPTFAKKTFSGLSAVGKYSTTAANDASYSNAIDPNPVSIAATSGTQVDGIKVTAPTTDPDGYVFAGWYTTTGSFTNPADKETYFKPNAANAVAIAKYKKIFKITSSVDSTGTGAGTVTTTKTSVEAGGEYDITATVKSGSAIESVKVNGTAKTATASQKISSVSADQTVVVKFKSNVYLRGGSTIGSNWSTGHEMTSNADGTEFTKTYENVAGSSSGTQYQFKLYVNGYNNDGSATINITGGTSTGTCTHQSSGDQNYVLTLKKAANVTVKSNGAKITEIKVVPANSAKYAVTFKKASNTTITGQYEGTNFTTASADATVQVYEGDEISFTVTATSGYHISDLTTGTTPTFSPTVSDYKITNVTAAKTITPTAAADVNVTAKSNKTARGTVTVDKSKSFKGDTVKITVTPKAGSLKSLTATYANGKTYEWKSGSTWNEVTASSGSSNTNALENVFINPLKASVDFAPTGAELDEAAIAAMPDLVPVGAAQTINMVMQDDSAVTINATFDTYSGESTWYYNGYDKDSGNAVSGYHGKQMTESMVSGEKFSYYHVSGRTGTDQTFTVSNGAASSGTRYVYFTASAENGWSTDENHQYAYFYNNNGAAGNNWPGYKMTKYTTNDYGQNVYRVEIPTSSSPTGVVFNNASNAPHKTTNVTDLSKGGYYLLSSSYNDNGTTVHDWQSYDCTYPSAGYSTGTEYFYDSEIFTTDFSTKGFYDHNVGSTKFTKPKDLGSDSGDYYINVLYAGKTYTINGVTKTIGSKPLVIWSAEPLAGDEETVTVYAKDGSIRSDNYGSTYANIADTKFDLEDRATNQKLSQRSGNVANQTYEIYRAEKGETIVVKTQIGVTDSADLTNKAALIAKYYVRGFCINGEVTELLEPNDTGLYTLTYKIPEDIEDGTKIEITPIYYLKDTGANPVVTYRVTGFTDELKQVGSGKPGWGNTLYTYPYYGKLGGDSNAFGAYPGQPMVYYKGQYQMQIPQKSTTWVNNTSSSTTVSGVTMSNGYWDSVHKQIMGYGDNSTSADHVQTYDYGDFYKIFNEKKPVDNIVFDFKYRTAKHNLIDITTTNTTASALQTKYGTGGNGFELLTNFHGRNVDLFGTPLSGDQLNATPVYVVSTGGVIDNQSGVENIAGYYATEWVVYGNTSGDTYQRISGGGKNSIPPEVLVLNDDDDTSFSNTTYPSADASHTLTQWKALYTALEAYRGKPVMISYEAADAQQGQGMYYTGTGGATRNDGRWLYSKNGESITSKIKIQYSENGTDYTDLDTTTPQVEGLEAYFTNADAYKKQTYSTTIDPDKTFDFEAKTTNADYMFVGWFMADGTKITSDNESHTERSGSYTFVAKFKKVTDGQLVLSHSVATGETVRIDGNDYVCDGSGTAKIGVVVKDHETGETLATYEAGTSDITLDKRYINSEKNYDIEVVLIAVADTNTALGKTKLATEKTGVTNEIFFNGTPVDSGKTRTYTLAAFNVKEDLFDGTTQKTTSLTYHSYFIQYKFNYAINYSFVARSGETEQYKRIGTLTSAEANQYVEKRDTARYLLKSFIEKMAPYESNFGQDITWNFEDVLIDDGGSAGSNFSFNINKHFTAVQTNLNKRNITFVLPYQHNDGVAVMNDGVGTKATSTNLELIEVKDQEGTVTADNRVDFNTIPVLPNNAENGIFDEDGKKNWIAAPATITDEGSVLNFQYWSVKPTDRAGESDPDVARCYFQGFNFVAYDNYIITPVYGETTVEPSEIGRNTNITYVETTRNQWNSNGTDYPKTQTSSAADLLYNDFIVAYNYDGKDIYNGDANADIAELGVVVERIQKLEIKDDGTYDTTLSRYTGIAPDETGVNNAINHDGDIALSGKNKISKHAIAASDLDNKNRIQFYNGIYNSAGWVQNDEGGAPAQNYGYKNYVYRAYSYMKLKDGTVIKSAVPAYFTMYDVATADSGDM